METATCLPLTFLAVSILKSKKLERQVQSAEKITKSIFLLFHHSCLCLHSLIALIARFISQVYLWRDSKSDSLILLSFTRGMSLEKLLRITR